MNAPPVAHRELLVAARRRATFWIRLGAGLIASVAVGFGLLAGTTRAGGALGAGIFQFLLWLTAVTVGGAGVLLTADAISAERREGTLGFLFLTDLTGFDVLAGKLAAAGLNAAGALLTVLPVMALTLLLGGVTAGDFWRSALALLNLLWVSLAIGLAMSTRTTESSRAFLSALIWAVLLLVAFPIGAATVRQLHGPPALGEIFSLSPTWALICGRDVTYQLEPAAFWRSVGGSHVCGWLFLLFAARSVPRLWRGDSAIASETASTAGRRPRARASVENPVAALTSPGRRENALAWVVVAISLAGTALLWKTEFAGTTWPIFGAWPFLGAAFVLKCLFAWKCCGFFHQLRVGGGELLLTAPLHELQVLGGAWTGARRLVQSPMIVLAAISLGTPVLHWLLGDNAAMRDPFPGFVGFLLNLYRVLCLIADVVALGWLSARFGLRSRSAIQAFALCVALLFLPRLVLFCVPDLLLSVVVMAWARGTVAPSVRGWITGDRLPPLHSRSEAARQGRIVPETL